MSHKMKTGINAYIIVISAIIRKKNQNQVIQY
jgi:hypothetical protein